MDDDRPNVFIEWKRNLLARHGLRWPDGRELYLYRLSAVEFDELERLLAESFARGLTSLADPYGVNGFPCLFVLYASEWWRRKYDGTHWSWDPILREIGANPDDWSQGRRSECILLGLQEWKLKPREDGGLRFLGSVAVQGGLPLKLLTEARGRLSHLLGQVLRQAGTSSVTPSDLLTWVKSLRGGLQKSYQQEIIFILLADMAWTVLRLKDEAGLTSSADAIERLNQQIPSWRDRFPLSLEDIHAQTLIEQLIRDVTSLPVERNALCLPVERRLELAEGADWTVRSSVTLPDYVPVGTLAKLFRVNIEDMPAFGELTLTAGAEQVVTSIRRMAGRDSYRLERKPWGFADAVATHEHLLYLSASDGRIWGANALKGEALDEELPWIFSAEEFGYQFMRQGSGGVSTIEALIAISPNGTIRPKDGADITPRGDMQSHNRRVFHIRGQVEICDAAGQTYRIRTGQAGSEGDCYEWHGERYWLKFKSPPMAFRSLPRLYRISKDGLAQTMEGGIGWNPLGNGALELAQPIGPVSLRYPAKGEIKQRARAVILPPTSALSIEPSDARSGLVKFERWGAMGASVLTPGVYCAATRSTEVLSLLISVPVAVQVPEWIEVAVYWPHTTQPACLTLPFPGKGARAFNADGTELQSGALIAAQRLVGMRLLVLAGQHYTRMTLELSVGAGRLVREYQLRALPDALGVEVRLQDFAADIQHSLSEDDRPDAHVRITLRLGGVVHFVLEVARYAATLVRSGNNICLDAASIQALPKKEVISLTVQALRLELPGDEAIVLPPCISEGASVGPWAFCPETREPGSWLIYPASDSPLPFRPTLWTVAGQINTDSPLAGAVRKTNQAAREAALDDVIEVMAGNFSAPDWVELERTANQVGHLPLTTLDLWRRLACSPKGMAAFALRFGTLPDGFLIRFAQELPFAWEAVPLVAWRQAVACLQSQCKNSFGGEVGSIVFESHLESRIKDMSSVHGAVDYVLGIATADFVSGAAQQRHVLKSFVGPTASRRLFDGDSSLLMHLRRAHADEKWPTGFNSLLEQARGKPEVAQYLCPQSHQFADGVINMPLFLAAEVAINQTSRWFEKPDAIHVLREYRAFDPEWFDEAYNLTIARCVADGIIA